MSFTPSLCAAILRPTHNEKKNRIFRSFDKGFDRISHTYVGQMGRAVRKAPRWMVGFVLITVLAGFLYTRLPTSFVPDEDQGTILALVNLPSGATLERTDEVMAQLRDKLIHSPIAKNIQGIFQPEGFSFVGQSENVGMAFIQLKPWQERSQTAMELIPLANQILHDIPDAQIFVNQSADHQRPEASLVASTCTCRHAPAKPARS